MSTAAPKTRDVLACPECGATYPLGTRFCKIDGAALDRAAGDPRAGGDPLIGKVIGGRYLIHKKLGEGGMGAVYAAEHTIMRRPVALKLVRDELAHDATVATRFVREARVATRLTAPEIVQVFDSGATEEGRLFLAMELLTGETLRERLARGALPEQEALRIGSAILRALVVAHGAGVVHRDLKPDNVFLCAGGQVKVLDFGIARVLGGDDEPSSVSVTATGAIVGTALYVSPEAVSRVKVGPAADRYSFGAILFEMLAGAPPFYDEHPVLLMGMHLRVPPPRLSDKAQRIFPSALEEIVARLLAKKPEERPSLEQALGLLASPLPSAPAPALAPPAPERPRRRWPLAFGAGVALVGGASVAFAALVAMSPAPGGPASAPEARVERSIAPSGAPPEPQVEPPSEPPSAPSAEPPATMVLGVTTRPAGASVELDGAPITPPHTMPADGAEHAFVVRAEGFEPFTRTFRAERDHDFDVQLVPVPAQAAAPPRARAAPPPPRITAPPPPPIAPSPPRRSGMVYDYGGGLTPGR